MRTHIVKFSWAALCLLGTLQHSLAAEPPDIEKISQSLLQIQLLSDGSYVGHGTGFYIAEDGKILTNFHVVDDVLTKGYTAVLAEKSGDGIGRPLELWQAWPEFDLAVVILKDHKATDRVTPLRLSPGDPKQAQQVWAVGYANDRHLGTTVTSGIVSGLRSVSDLRTLVPELVLESSPKARWVQTDCTINPGNSGGPMLASDGSVVGVNTFVALKGRSMYFSVASTCIAPLLTALPAKPIGFASLANLRPPEITRRPPEETPANSRPPAVEPRPVIEVPELRLTPLPETKPVQTAFTQKAGKLLTESVFRKCTHCKGTGKVTERVQVGTSVNPTGLSYPIMENRVRDCTGCDHGWTQSKPDAQLRLADNQVRNIAALEAPTTKNEAAQETALDDLRFALTCDALLKSEIVNETLKRARSKFVKPGTILVGSAAYAAKQAPGGKSRYVFSVDKDVFLVLYPKIDKVASDSEDPLIFTGIVTDIVTGKSGDRFIVAQGGVVAPMSEEANSLVKNSSGRARPDRYGP